MIDPPLASQTPTNRRSSCSTSRPTTRSAAKLLHGGQLLAVNVPPVTFK